MPPPVQPPRSAVLITIAEREARLILFPFPDDNPGSRAARNSGRAHTRGKSPTFPRSRHSRSLRGPEASVRRDGARRENRAFNLPLATIGLHLSDRPFPHCGSEIKLLSNAPALAPRGDGGPALEPPVKTTPFNHREANGRA